MDMENNGDNSDHQIKWKFQGNKDLNAASISVRGILNMLVDNLDKSDQRPCIMLGRGDPTEFPSFRTTPLAVDAVTDALRSFNFNSYAPTVGVLQGRRLDVSFNETFYFKPMHLIFTRTVSKMLFGRFFQMHVTNLRRINKLSLGFHAKFLSVIVSLSSCLYVFI